MFHKGLDRLPSHTITVQNLLNDVNGYSSTTLRERAWVRGYTFGGLRAISGRFKDHVGIILAQCVLAFLHFFLYTDIRSYLDFHKMRDVPGFHSAGHTYFTHFLLYLKFSQSFSMCSTTTCM